MWPFTKRLSAAISETRMSALELKVAHLEEQLLQLLGQHKKLRGTVYGRIGKGSDVAADGEGHEGETRAQLKARLLSKRFVPGQPAIHDP